MNTTIERSSRLHYLDWLLVVAILGVFLFHAIHPFDDVTGWHIKNADSSAVVNYIVAFFSIWGSTLNGTVELIVTIFSNQGITPDHMVPLLGVHLRETVGTCRFGLACSESDQATHDSLPAQYS